MMKLIELYANFEGYLQLNLPRLKWLFFFSVLFYVGFYFLKQRGCVKKSKSLATVICRILLSLNSAFILIMTLFGRKIGESPQFVFKPFESYVTALGEGNTEILLQIIMNVAMYIPLGFLLPCCFKMFEKYRYVVFVATISSLFIELTQLFFKIGLFEVDDIINNTLGAIIGLIVYMICVSIRRRYFEETITNEK